MLGTKHRIIDGYRQEYSYSAIFVGSGFIQLCGSVALAEGIVDVEYRMNDIKRRYGNYPQIKWDKNMEIKKYFEEKCGVEDIYDLLTERTSIGGRNV